MPLLDVSDILDDPDFADTFDVIRTHVSVGNDGVAVATTETLIGVVGVITAGLGDVLRRRAEGEQITGSITVHSQVPLVPGEAGQTADIVVYPSGSANRYTVAVTSDYSRYGAGFTAASCDRLGIHP